MIRERFAVIIGRTTPDTRFWKGVLRQWTVGTPTAVHWDAQWVIDRQMTHGDVIGFFHTHPPGVPPIPSDIDIVTMTAWSRAFGRPLLAVIRSSRTITGSVVTPTGALHPASIIRVQMGRIVAATVMKEGGLYAHRDHRM